MKYLNIKTVAAMLFALAMPHMLNAQSIVNPSFENGADGWTISGMVSQGNSAFTKKDGSKYLEKWVSKGSKVGDASVKQTLTSLKPGKYTLTVAAQNLDENNTSAACTGAVIYAGSTTTTVYTTNDYSVNFTCLSGTVEIGFKATGATGNWLAVDNFRLVRNGAPDLADMKTTLSTLIASANTLYGTGSGVNASALKTAIDDAQACYDNASSTAENMADKYMTLQTAIDSYKYDNASPSSPYDCTKYIVDPSFEVSKGWTNEGMVSQSNSSFSKKSGLIYMEKWVTQTAAVGDGMLSQTIKNLPNGKYRLTAAAQNISQANTSQVCTGAYIFAGDQQTAVNKTADYSVEFTSITGEITIGFKAVGANGNWLSVDNFRLALIGHVDKNEIVDEIKRLVSNAESLQDKMMSDAAAEALSNAIAEGNAITATSADADVQKAKKDIDSAIEAASKSIAEYKALASKIDEIKPKYDATKNGAAEFKAVLDNAEALAKDGKATSKQLADEIPALDKALLAFRLANATAGTKVSVSETNHHIVTGATQALVRATVTGSGILERGVCWSTEHNPTVLDERTTKSFSLNGTIYHIKGLKTATVYYVRPYVINNTYEVAYGDEVKLVTHPRGGCIGTWNEGAPTEEANKRCRNAINETIEYFNEWTGISGFTLTGNYGAGTATADCSYGGWMRIGPNAGNQAIGTVIHETGHGVGVGTSSRWSDTNVHNWKWYGREANRIYSFLENKEADPYNSEFCMVGDGQHGWGLKATYDWFVNGATYDTHQELQYIGGCALLYGLFVDGLNPTTGYKNGLAGYTYNFDDSKKYYLMCKDANVGLGTGLIYQRSSTAVNWNNLIGEGAEIGDEAAWYIEYDPQSGHYRFKNVKNGSYLVHTTTMSASKSPSSGANEYQLMPDRTDVTVTVGSKTLKTHGYWMTWVNSDGSIKSVLGKKYSTALKYGTLAVEAFDFADTATAQQWIILSEDEVKELIATGIDDVRSSDEEGKPIGYYSLSGIKLAKPQKGINIIKYSNGKSKTVTLK